MKTILCAALASLSLILSAGAAVPEFSGYLTVGGESFFVLRDLGADRASEWLVLGQSFQGCDLLAFDAKAERLSVRFGGETLALPLRVSQGRTHEATAETVQQLAEARQALVKLRMRYRSAHPQVQKLLRRIWDLEAQVPK